MTQRTPIRIFDTTLRDGEQSPGASLNHQEKLEIARQLEALGVDVIEAGFPITSQGDFDAVRAIGQELSEPIVAGLSRCHPRDIDRAGEALQGANHPRIHVFCATSKIHLEHKLKKPFEQIRDIAVESVERAKQYTDDVEFSPEDASRTELDQLVDITGAVIEAGATTVNLPDTVGYSTPAEYGRVFSYLRKQLPQIDEKGIVLSSHCHNDLGLAVANSLAAVQGGAKQIECTINGIGERAGNAALEEIVMALHTRADFYESFTTRINTQKIYPTSRMVANLTGLHVQRNKAVIGENAFAHEAGIHQDGMLKERSTYEIMDPRDLGVPESKLVLGKHSGHHAMKRRIADLGYTIDEDTLNEVYEAFKKLADKKKHVYDEDLEAILDQQLHNERATWELTRFQVTSGSEAIATATVVIQDSDGNEQTDAATGDGPIDAVYSAIQRITGIEVTLQDYHCRGITGGKDAQGEASVQVTREGQSFHGRGFSTDVVEAAARALLAAINRIRNTEMREQSQAKGEHASIATQEEAAQP
jgi:2-isopropylmalate synthase